MAGLEIPRVFSDKKVGPYTEIDWENRTAEIKAADGSIVFRQENVNVPKSWSQLATNIVASKYFYGEQGTPERETSVATLISRVVMTITKWGKEDGYFASDKDGDLFHKELTWLCLNQYGSFNSPVWFNVGVREKPQTSACFLQSVDDNMESIMDLAKSEAMLFKYGSGTGTDLTPLRSSKEKLTGGGKPSGPVSFMKLYDTIGGIIKSGGKCLAYEQPVYTESGIRTAGELAKSDSYFVVLSWSNRLGRVSAKTARAWFSGVKHAVEVVTDKGTFKVSIDHPFMLSTGESVKAEDLKKGMSLKQISVDVPHTGYVRVGLQDGMKGKDNFHRMVARDVCGWDIDNLSVHHKDGNKFNCHPSNLSVLTQAEHAGLHGKGNAFYTEGLLGSSNGMHSSSKFWSDDERVSNYRQKQSEILKNSGRAQSMQRKIARKKMMEVGYELINAGHDISSFESFCRAKYVSGRRGQTKSTQFERINRVFGSYQGYLDSLATNNHRVVSIRSLGEIGVVSIEVDDQEPDDKRRWSEHNYAIAPIGTVGHSARCAVTLNTRRAARLNCLQVSHPDIMEFIQCKVKEERKAKALIDAGYDADFNGEAYSTVAFQNTNISVRVTDEFMKSIDEGFNFYTFNSSDGKECERIDPDKILTKMAESAWECGDPGIQYHDTLNAWHTCPNTAAQSSSNPCGEFVFLPDTACNLASLNLMKFRQEDGSFDIDRFRAAVRIFIIAMDILIDRSSYPTEKIAQNSRDYRPLGLGYANLGAYVMSLGFPYDSDEARSFAASVTALMTGEAYKSSNEIAKFKDAFAGYELNREPMSNVMEKHRNAMDSIKDCSVIANSIYNAAKNVWNNNCNYMIGYRNAQVTVLAPCGTIGFMMDCDTTGIEPELALVKHKSLAGGGSLKLVNQTVPMALEKLGYDKVRANRIVDYIAGEHGANSPPGLLEKDKAVFDCSFPGINGRSIAPSGHIKMMAAVQPFLSGAISKTVNMPYDSTVEDIKEAYMEGWRLGLKSLSIYRDGSKGSQPLNTKKDEKYKFKRYLIDPVGERTMEYPNRNDRIDFPKFCPDSPVRTRLPMTRKSVTHKFDIQGHEGYIHVGMYDDGRPGEMFITMAKQGSTVSGLMDALATSVSISLQYGIPLKILSEKLKHTRYEPCGFTKNKEIPITSSICDYVFRWMEQQFSEKVVDNDVLNSLLECPEMVLASYPTSDQFPILKIAGGAPYETDSPLCDICGSLTERNGTCYRCRNCGNSMGCS